MKIAVVILNWNGRKLLEQFLPGVVEHSNHPDVKVVVADNASTDDSVAYVKQHFPEVELVINQENGGFAKGYNDALKAVEAEYFVLLNSDVEVTPNWIAPILSLMEQDPAIAACQPKVRAQRNPKYFEHAGAAGGYMDKDGYMFCRGRIFDDVEEDQGQYDTTEEIFWATGACLFIRSQLYFDNGGLDEDFFAHMEEIDLCYRLKNQGHKIMVCPESTVYHVGGATLQSASPRKTFLNFRNNLYLLTKNHFHSPLVTKIFWRMVLDGLAAYKFLFSGKAGHFFAIMKAHFAFYGNLGTFLKRRKMLKAKRKTPNLKGLYQRSLIADAFLKGRKKFSELDQSSL